MHYLMSPLCDICPHSCTFPLQNDNVGARPQSPPILTSSGLHQHQMEEERMQRDEDAEAGGGASVLPAFSGNNAAPDEVDDEEENEELGPIIRPKGHVGIEGG